MHHSKMYFGWVDKMASRLKKKKNKRMKESRHRGVDIRRHHISSTWHWLDMTFCLSCKTQISWRLVPTPLPKYASPYRLSSICITVNCILDGLTRQQVGWKCLIKRRKTNERKRVDTEVLTFSAITFPQLGIDSTWHFVNHVKSKFPGITLTLSLLLCQICCSL